MLVAADSITAAFTLNDTTKKSNTTDLFFMIFIGGNPIPRSLLRAYVYRNGRVTVGR
jgi:hypothetical protein